VNSLEKIDSRKELPASPEELGEFILIGDEALKAQKAKIRAIQRVNLGQAVYQRALEESQKMGERVLWAYARLGELLRAIPDFHSSGRGTMKRKQLPDGINKKLSHRAQRIAEYKELISQVVAKAVKRGDIPTRKDFEVAVKEIQRKKLEKESEGISFPSGKYRTIVVDPPWKYQDTGSRATGDYPLMSVEEIIQFEIERFCLPECHLYLWATNAFLHDGFHVLEAWGFQYKNIITWKKNKIGMGHWMRNITEHCLFAVKGNLKTDLSNQVNFIEGKLREHSRKPEEFYRLVESLSPEPRIDIFGRERRRGWEVFGVEPDKFKALRVTGKNRIETRSLGFSKMCER